jgi:hypothetical protein
LYHITGRGNEKKTIFPDSRDREAFLELLSLVIERFDWILGQFGENRPRAVKAYKQFVLGGYGDEFPHDELVGQVTYFQ